MKIIFFFLLVIFASCATQWQTKSNSPNVKIGSSASWGVDQNNNFRIYVIGGDNQTIANNLVDGFDVFNNNWVTFSPMNNNRTRHASVTYYKTKNQINENQQIKSVNSLLDLKIFVFGGQHGISMSECEVYNPRTDTWNAIAPMTIARHGLAAAVGNNGKIYVFGGENGNAILNTVEEYNPGTNTWTTKNNMPGKRAWLGAATGSDGYIYLTGGSMGQEEDNLWKYDPSSDTYTTLTNMPTVSSRHDSVAGHGDRIFVLGNVSYQYDISDNVWSVVDEMPCEYRIDGAAESFLNDVYLIGGFRRFNPPTNCNEVYRKGWF